MKQYDLISDSAEHVIGDMFCAVQIISSKQFGYSLLFNPKNIRNWVAVLLSAAAASFKELLRMELAICSTAI